MTSRRWCRGWTASKTWSAIEMADPSNVLAVDDIAIMTGYEIRVAVAPPDDIAALVSRLDRLEDVVGDRDRRPVERVGSRRHRDHDRLRDPGRGRPAG